MMTIRLISNIGYYIIVIVFFMASVSVLGIDLTSLSLIAGALSIGIGFGLQTVVSNLIAGIIIMFERTIRIGDIIEIDNSVSGIVTDMRIRSTTIKTYDNIDIIVPNSSFIQNNVINLTLEDRIRRLHIPFGVAYGTEIQDVKKAVLDALDKSDLKFVRDDEDKKPDVRMTLMNASSVDLELIVWVSRGVKLKLKQISVESDFLILIYDALRKNNISIPYPQLDVHMKSE
jgi:small-conductance mechanosensitive channel